MSIIPPILYLISSFLVRGDFAGYLTNLWINLGKNKLIKPGIKPIIIVKVIGCTAIIYILRISLFKLFGVYS